MKFSKFFLALLLTYSISTSRAQEVIIKAELDTNKALIGDQIKLRLLVDKPQNIQVSFPTLKDSITRDIEIVGDALSDTVVSTSGRVVLSRELLIAVFDTGFYEIPELSFAFQSGGLADTLKSLPVPFEIVSVKADSTIRDIKAIYKAPITLAEIITYIKEDYPYVLLVVGAALLIWFVVRYFRKRKGHGIVSVKEKPVELPEVIAMRELEKLKEEKPWLHNKVKLYHIRVSEILRAYIENRFRIAALEQTTEEILISMKPPLCKSEDYNRLSSILKLADLVKFAKIIPAVNENVSQIELAVEFIHDTTVHEESLKQEVDTEEAVVESNKTL